MTWTIRIDEPTGSLNTWQRLHFLRKTEEIERWAWLLKFAQTKLSKNIPNATGKRRVTVIRYGKKLLDLDNAMGGLKPVMDAMVVLGMLKDDCPALLDLRFDQGLVERGIKPHTEITIEEAA